MNLPVIFWLIPLASVCALMMAWLFFRNMMKEDEGTPRMKEIALYIRRGAMAYLRQQYRVVLIVFIVLAIIFAIKQFFAQKLSKVLHAHARRRTRPSVHARSARFRGRGRTPPPECTAGCSR